MSENKIKIARHTKREYYPIISYYNDWVIHQNLIPAFIMKTFSDLIHHLILYWIVSAIPVYIKVIPEVFNDKKFLFLP